MLTSDVKIFVAKCLATMPEFMKTERKNFPENKFILRNSVDLNRNIRMRLDAIKHEVGIVAEDVYITEWTDRNQTVNMGATLLNRQVVFSGKFSFRRLMRSGNSPDYRYLFEEEFMKRYNDCWKQFNTVKYEIDLAWKARDLGQSAIASALLEMEEDYRRELDSLTHVDTSKKNSSTRLQIMQRLENIRQLIFKLNKIYKGAY